MPETAEQKKRKKPPTAKQLSTRGLSKRAAAAKRGKRPVHTAKARGGAKKAKRGPGRAERFITSFIPGPIMALNGRRRNGSSKSTAARRTRSFHGREVNGWSEDTVSRHVSSRTIGSDLGRLRKIKVRSNGGRSQTVNFGSRAKLIQVGPRHLAIANAQFKRPPVSNPNGVFNAGEVEEVEYVADKPHLGHPKKTVFYHQHGEETGKRPSLYIDDEGYALIKGGKMRILPDGITD